MCLYHKSLLYKGYFLEGGCRDPSSHGYPRHCFCSNLPIKYFLLRNWILQSLSSAFQLPWPLGEVCIFLLATQHTTRSLSLRVLSKAVEIWPTLYASSLQERTWASDSWEKSFWSQNKYQTLTSENIPSKKPCFDWIHF